MSSRLKATNPNPIDLSAALGDVGLRAISASVDDFLARATKARWSPRQILEQMAHLELVRPDPTQPAEPARPCPTRTLQADRGLRLELAQEDRARRHRARPGARLPARGRRCCTALAESKMRLLWWPRYVRP